MAFTIQQAEKVQEMLDHASKIVAAVAQGQKANTNYSTTYDAIENNAAVVDAAKAVLDVVQTGANDVTKVFYQS